MTPETHPWKEEFYKKFTCAACPGEILDPNRQPKEESPDQADWENPIRRFYFGGGWSKEQLLEYISSLLARVRKEERKRAAEIASKFVSPFESPSGETEYDLGARDAGKMIADKILTPEQP